LGVYQDRFVKELKLLELRRLKGANALSRRFLRRPETAKFAVAPREERTIIKPFPRAWTSPTIFAYERNTPRLQ